MTKQEIQKILDRDYKQEQDMYHFILPIDSAYNSLLINMRDPFYKSFTRTVRIVKGETPTEADLKKSLDKVFNYRRPLLPKYYRFKLDTIQKIKRKIANTFFIDLDKIDTEAIEFSDSYSVSFHGIMFSYETAFSTRDFRLYLKRHSNVLLDILNIQTIHNTGPKEMLDIKKQQDDAKNNPKD